MLTKIPDACSKYLRDLERDYITQESIVITRSIGAGLGSEKTDIIIIINPNTQ